MNGRFSTFIRIARQIEDTFLVGLLTVVIALAGLQIFLRNVMDTGFLWADELLRIQVLWLGLLGAVAASRDDKHISIDVLSKLLPKRVQLATRTVVDIFTASICILITWFGARFVLIEREYGSTALDGVPIWIFEIIIPLGFGIIALRYVVYFFVHLRQFISEQ